MQIPFIDSENTIFPYSWQMMIEWYISSKIFAKYSRKRIFLNQRTFVKFHAAASFGGFLAESRVVLRRSENGEERKKKER